MFVQQISFTNQLDYFLLPDTRRTHESDTCVLCQAVVYEEPGFQGTFREVDSNICSFPDSGDAEQPKSVGSLKVIGGL